MSASVVANDDRSPAAREEEAVRRAAVAWYVRLCSGEASVADHLAWQQWHGEHPDHQRAWQRIESIRMVAQRVPAAVGRPTLDAASKGRRHVLRSLGLLASAGALAYGGYRIGAGRGADMPWTGLLADFRTGTGEQRTVDLADGSRVLLNTRSAIDVAFDESRRLVRLRAGEVLIDTAKHRAPAVAAHDTRPFLVETAHGTICALGTRFIVRDDDVQTRVTVLEDRVEVRMADTAGDPFLLRAGEQLGFSRHTATPIRSADPAAEAWAHGSLVVDDWRLGDVVAELARYHTGRLVCDAEVADIRVSGAFPIHDTERALTAIMHAFPVRVRSLTRYWVNVGAV